MAGRMARDSPSNNKSRGEAFRDATLAISRFDIPHDVRALGEALGDVDLGEKIGNGILPRFYLCDFEEGILAAIAAAAARPSALPYDPSDRAG